MKTVTPTPEEMANRLARFAALQPLQATQERSVPIEARDLIYSRKLLPVITLDENENSPIAEGAPIKGAAGMTMTWAVIPSGSGPSLHSHDRTFETFTVVKGRVEFSWGDRGEQSFVLEPFDVLSFPPRVCRAFKNVGDSDAIIQVLITGGKHDMSDIGFPPDLAVKLAAIDPGYVEKLKSLGVTFEAGVD